MLKAGTLTLLAGFLAAACQGPAQEADETVARSPLETVNLRMRAYNEHDLDAFLSTPLFVLKLRAAITLSNANYTHSCTQRDGCCRPFRSQPSLPHVEQYLNKYSYRLEAKI